MNTDGGDVWQLADQIHEYDGDAHHSHLHLRMNGGGVMYGNWQINYTNTTAKLNFPQTNMYRSEYCRLLS